MKNHISTFLLKGIQSREVFLMHITTPKPH